MNTYKWGFIERISVQLVQIITLVIVSNYITPEEFGIVSLTTIITSISQVFVDGGLGAALLRKKKVTNKHYETVFFISFFVSALLYIIILIFSPFYSSFYSEDITTIMYVTGVNVLLGSFIIIPRTKLTRELNFYIQSKSSIISVVFSCIIAILLSMLGFGLWSLVFQVLIYNFLNSIFLNLFSGWFPKFKFDFLIAKDLWNYSYKIFFSSLLEVLYQNVFSIVIAKKFSIHDVGVFNQGRKLADIPSLTISSVLQKINLPTMVKVNNEDELRLLFIKTIKISTIIVTPLLVGFSLISDIFIDLLLGPSWSDSSKVMQIICLAGIFYPSHVVNLNLLQVKKFSDKFLKIELIKKFFGLGLLIVTMNFNVNTIAIGILLYSIVSVFINAYYTYNIIKVSILEQLYFIVKPLLYVLISLFVAEMLTMNISNEYVKVISLLVLSLFFYVSLIYKLSRVEYYCIKEYKF